ncbi:hypothetical protein TH5N_18290 [Tetragenococcus halophilus]|nr:hypothetical protein TH3N_17960 [Tetragenococcus halophilus]GEQ40951.1 hypothetical protein TH5N_18290 [Tetragenococcus halophilus]GEQ43188.1 hypothetical protein TH6N_18140 [Tetragenococcus halophilus]GEQ45460.1 hypothetical protein TH8N_18300 [Tetragenococcus halophilus]GEQ47720.1 hypothetical protein TH9N_18330 [Tetragenococcus halophilus]
MKVLLGSQVDILFLNDKAGIFSIYTKYFTLSTIDNYYFDTMLLMYLVVEILFAKYVDFLRETSEK